MERELYEGTITTQKGFYIGDPCYALPDWIYYDQWGKEKNWQDGEIYVPEVGVSFATGSTAYGDGYYHDDKGRRSFPVDSGTLALVPIELIEGNDIRGLGCCIECQGEARYMIEDGVFDFELPNGEEIIIDTRGEELDKDDEYLIPDEQRDEEDEEYEEDEDDE